MQLHPAFPSIPVSPVWVQDRAWLEFVKRFIAAHNDQSSNNWGAFGFKAQRLFDLGIATSVGIGNHEGKTRWSVTWDDANWLRSKKAQYETFEKSMSLYASDSTVQRMIGRVVKNGSGTETATLSGVLLIAHKVGPSVARWICDPAYREGFTHTQAMFSALNNVF